MNAIETLTAIRAFRAADPDATNGTVQEVFKISYEQCGLLTLFPDVPDETIARVWNSTRPGMKSKDLRALLEAARETPCPGCGAPTGVIFNGATCPACMGRD